MACNQRGNLQPSLPSAPCTRNLFNDTQLFGVIANEKLMVELIPHSGNQQPETCNLL